MRKEDAVKSDRIISGGKFKRGEGKNLRKKD